MHSQLDLGQLIDLATVEYSSSFLFAIKTSVMDSESEQLVRPSKCRIHPGVFGFTSSLKGYAHMTAKVQCV